MIKSIENTVAVKLPEAFLPDYIADDRPIEKLLEEFAAYASPIPFIDENGQQLGYWDEMYSEQVLFLLIDIDGLDIDTLERRKKAIMESPADRESKAFALLHEVLGILKMLYDKAKRLDTPWIVKEIAALIESTLFADIDALKKQLPAFGKKNELENFNLWLEWLEYEKPSHEIETNVSEENILKLTLNAINDSINCLHHLRRKLNSKKFDETLQDGTHPAHIGLLYGFLKSYEVIQKRFNGLPKRHLDYYFKTILKQDPIAAQPDDTYLFIQLVPTVQSLEIAPDTAFVAGLDKNGNDVIFETTQTFNLSSAKITELRTLLFHKSDTILPLRKAQMVTGVYMDALNTPEFNGIRNSKDSWALCGEPIINKKKHQLPEIGWAIASYDFFLTSGIRKVKLSFELTGESTASFDALLSKITTTEAGTQSYTKKEALYRFLNDAFALQITAPTGMFAIENYTVNISEKAKNKKRVFEFQFTLSAKAPGWIPYSESTHGSGFKTTLPLLSIKLKQESVYYPYSLIGVLKIETLKIAVDVNNLQNLLVYNKHGIVNPAGAFPIFGMNPLMGNSVFIGAKEWQYKKITAVDVKINWLDLPIPNFREYYKNYTSQPITDDRFQVSMHDNDATIPLGNLFNTDNDNKLVSSTSFSNIKINKIPDRAGIIEDFNPSSAPLAFVSIRLDSPEAGFGSEIYPSEMSRYGQELISNIRKKTVTVPPQKPFIPMAESIVVNYRSKSQIAFTNNSKIVQRQPFDFFHIDAFGVGKIGDDKKINSNKLLPDHEAEGSLYIGLQDSVPLTELSIFMKLVPTEVPLKKEHTTIHYLNGKYWKILPPENIIEDTTNHCQETGSIRILLPADLLSDHQFLDQKKQWLRFSFESADLNALGRCVYINTNMIAVKRKLGHEASFDILEPFSITGLSGKNPAIQSISQPFHSFGGRQKETETHFYSRVSNRLGHKNRMVRERDYRRMILEKFPEINWLKVLSPSKYPETVRPGELRLIVMPKIENTDDFSNYFASKHTLKNIKDYVLEHCAPGLSITVSTPDYEIVEVRCSVSTTSLVPTSFKKEITEIIKKRMAPWLYHNGIHYKGVSTKFSVGNLISEINRHPCVEDVLGCQVIRLSKSSKGYAYFDSVTDGEIIMPSTGTSVLIPARTFEIKLVAADEEKLSFGTMNIGEDLILSPKKATEKHADSITDDGNADGKTYFISLKI